MIRHRMTYCASSPAIALSRRLAAAIEEAGDLSIRHQPSQLTHERYRNQTAIAESFTASACKRRLDGSATSSGTIAEASQNLTGPPAAPRPGPQRPNHPSFDAVADRRTVRAARERGSESAVLLRFAAARHRLKTRNRATAIDDQNRRTFLETIDEGTETVLGFGVSQFDCGNARAAGGAFGARPAVVGAGLKPAPTRTPRTVCLWVGYLWVGYLMPNPRKVL
jgi:hypothetical protein